MAACRRDVLHEWLGDLSLDTFRSEYLGRAACARPCTGRTALPRLDWTTLARIVGAAVPSDVIVCARGAMLPMPPPRSHEHVRALFAAGLGLWIRHGERVEPALAQIVDGFAELGPAHVQVFATPGATHGFGWHFDDEDVFIVQTAGTKDYYFRANTVTEGSACADAFTAFPQERSALCSATLVPGDFLYIPARWWHMAIAQDDSLSISVGVTR